MFTLEVDLKKVRNKRKGRKSFSQGLLLTLEGLQTIPQMVTYIFSALVVLLILSFLPHFSFALSSPRSECDCIHKPGNVIVATCIKLHIE